MGPTSQKVAGLDDLCCRPFRDRRRYLQLRTELQGFVPDLIEGSDDLELERELASGGVPMRLNEADIICRLHFVVEDGTCKFDDGILPLDLDWVSETDWVDKSGDRDWDGLNEAFNEPGDHVLSGITPKRPFLGNVVRSSNGTLEICGATTPDEIARVADLYRAVSLIWNWLATQIGKRRTGPQPMAAPPLLAPAVNGGR